jgi:hypothetical protein
MLGVQVRFLQKPESHPEKASGFLEQLESLDSPQLLSNSPALFNTQSC